MEGAAVPRGGRGDLEVGGSTGGHLYLSESEPAFTVNATIKKKPGRIKTRSTSFLRSSASPTPSPTTSTSELNLPAPTEHTALLSDKHAFYQYHPEHSAIASNNIVPLETLITDHVKAHALFYAIASIMFVVLILLMTFLWNDLGWQAWYSAIVIFITFLLLIKRITEPAAVMLGTTTLLLIPGVITPAEALLGFSNSGVFSIAVLFVVAAGIAQTGSIRLVADLLLGDAKSLLSAQLRLFPPCCFLSAFTNNTPLCALLLPGTSAGPYPPPSQPNLYI